jgi:hypothetical protein
VLDRFSALVMPFLFLCAASAEAATVRGSVSAATTRRSDVVTLRMWPTAEGSAKETSFICPIIGGEWECPVDAGEYDIEITASALAPVYFWGVEVAADATVSLGPLEFHDGGELWGVVHVKTIPAGGVVVEAIPQSSLTGPDSRRDQLRTRSTITNRDGTFSFTGLTPAAHMIVARKEGYSSASIRDVQVRPGQEADAGVLRLRPRSRLEIEVSPPVDFRGSPWQIMLSRALPGSRYHEVVARGEASAGGRYDAEDLEQGSYSVEVQTSRGEVFAKRRIETPEETSVVLLIKSVPIEGTIAIGGQPLEATVTLLSEEDSQVTFTARDGVFRGVAPSEGEYRVSIRIGSAIRHLESIQVRPSEDGVARIALDLGGGAIHGRVVDREGDGVRAAVMLFREQLPEGLVDSADDGSFTFTALDAGSRVLQANAVGATSAPKTVDVEADGAVDVRLTVEPNARIGGEVVDILGRGIPGAAVRYIAPPSGPREVTTTLNGGFSFDIPAGSGSVGIAVVAAGLPRKLVTVNADRTGVYVRLQLGPSSRLHVDLASAPPWPFITLDGVFFFGLPELFSPRAAGPPAEFRTGGFSLAVEPARYTICRSPRLESGCQSVFLAPGSEARISPFKATEEMK